MLDIRLPLDGFRVLNIHRVSGWLGGELANFGICLEAANMFAISRFIEKPGSCASLCRFIFDTMKLLSKGVFMITNFLFTVFYLFAAAFLALAAWFHTINLPTWFLWLGAGAFLLAGLWRLLHLSRGR